jgi:hypothetical protein
MCILVTALICSSISKLVGSEIATNRTLPRLNKGITWCVFIVCQSTIVTTSFSSLKLSISAKASVGWVEVRNPPFCYDMNGGCSIALGGYNLPILRFNAIKLIKKLILIKEL